MDQLEVGVGCQLSPVASPAQHLARRAASLVEEAVEVLAELLVHPRRGQHLGEDVLHDPPADPVPDGRAQLLEIAPERARVGARELNPALVPRRQHQGLLGVPAPVDGGLADARPGRDGVHGEAGQPGLPDEVERGLEDGAVGARVARPAGLAGLVDRARGRAVGRGGHHRAHVSSRPRRPRRGWPRRRRSTGRRPRARRRGPAGRAPGRAGSATPRRPRGGRRRCPTGARPRAR